MKLRINNNAEYVDVSPLDAAKVPVSIASERKKSTMKMKVTGEFLTSAVRAVKDPYETCAVAIPDLPAAHIKAILDGRARIEGDNIDGYKYVEESRAERAQE